MASKVVMEDAFKRFTFDQDKVLTPEETVQRFKDKLKEVDLDVLEKTMRIDNRHKETDGEGGHPAAVRGECCHGVG
jgi:hypothetical protein